MDDCHICLKQLFSLRTILSETVALHSRDGVKVSLLPLVQAVGSVTKLEMSAIIRGKFYQVKEITTYFYLFIVVDNSSPQLHHSDVIIERGINIVWMSVHLLHLQQLLILRRCVANCIDFDLKQNIFVSIQQTCIPTSLRELVASTSKSL